MYYLELQNLCDFVFKVETWYTAISISLQFSLFHRADTAKKKTNLSAEDKVKWLNMTLLKRTVCDNSIPMATA